MSVWESTAAPEPTTAPEVSQDATALAPPPELAYKSKEELVFATQEWARNHGYAIVIKKLYPSEN